MLPLFVGGTGSHVGKSWMTAAICRHLKRRGLRVAPFKAQNMSNNSCPCPDGGEIGRAQASQAAACGLEPHPDMNPILLKPTSEKGCQVVVNGRVWRDLSATAYYDEMPFLWSAALEAFARLSSQCDVVVIEGAGSVAELNLWTRDLVNLPFAEKVSARGLLVGDIDRGGIFASVAGTYWLLPEPWRRLLPCFAVNRFRGDRRLFADGVGLLEEKAGARCLGVFGYEYAALVDEEDGVAAEDRPRRGSAGAAVAILAFPCISNLTDFRLLTGAAWIRFPVDRQFEAVILPGTKHTLADLAWLRRQGLDRWLERQHAGGARLLGICGGYQMLGQRITDPLGVEGGGGAEGLRFLPVETELAAEKVTRAVRACTSGGVSFDAYEIHMGRTAAAGETLPLAQISGVPEGAREGRIMGTYLHGATEHSEVLAEWLSVQLPPAPSVEERFEALADWFERDADLRLFEKVYL
ncbi:MAG: cobyric acid synthase [Candidatus Latescibacterota bacterium]|jgi:adenosylcobyric acid synthase